MSLFTRQKQTYRYWKQTYGYQRGSVGGRNKSGAWYDHIYTIWPASWETCMQVRKQQLELDMEQQTGSKQEKEYVKVVYCHPAYLTYM